MSSKTETGYTSTTEIILSFFIPPMQVGRIAGILIQMDTSAKFAMQIRYSAFFAALIFATFYPLLPISGGDNIAASHLYFLAATPTEHTDKSYPATLYSSSPDKKLKFIREVVSTSDGVRSVQAWGDVIFIIHPHILSTALTVVHTNEPMLVDDVLFNRS